MNTCAVLIAANDGTRPAEDLGRVPHLIKGADFACISETGSVNIAPNIRRNPCCNCCAISNIWPRFGGGETLDTTVSNVSSTCFDVPKGARQGAHCCQFICQWRPCVYCRRRRTSKPERVCGKSASQNGPILALLPLCSSKSRLPSNGNRASLTVQTWAIGK